MAYQYYYTTKALIHNVKDVDSVLSAVIRASMPVVPVVPVALLGSPGNSRSSGGGQRKYDGD